MSKFSEARSSESYSHEFEILHKPSQGDSRARSIDAAAALQISSLAEKKVGQNTY